MRMYDKYKDTGIIWIGAIPTHWNLRLLSQVSYEYFVSNKKIHHQNLLSLSYGKVIRKDINKTEGLLPASFDTYQVVSEGNIILRLTDLQNDQKSLRVGLVKEEGIITSAYICLRVLKDSISPTYLYNVLHSYDVRKLFYSMGGGLRQGLNWQGLKKINIPLPPFAEQEKIVSYLNNKTSKIDEFLLAKEEQIRLLHELKESEIANVITRGLNPNVKMKSYNSLLTDSCPEHWEIKRNKSFLSLTGEKVGERANDFVLLSLTTKGVIVRDIESGKGKFPKDFGTYQVVKKDDLILCLFDIDETPRTIGLVETEGMITGAYTALQVDKEYALPEYIYYYYFCVDNIKGLKPYYSGLRKTVRADKFLQLYLPLPSLHEQQAIVLGIKKMCSKVNSLITELEAEIEYLKEYKQSLIADCVTGQINVQQ